MMRDTAIGPVGEVDDPQESEIPMNPVEVVSEEEEVVDLVYCKYCYEAVSFLVVEGLQVQCEQCGSGLTPCASSEAEHLRNLTARASR